MKDVREPVCAGSGSCKMMGGSHLWIEKLDGKLRIWKPETVAEVRERVAEVIELAGEDALDLMPSRSREQEVLDILDDPTAR